jgi:hypothetical protein
MTAADGLASHATLSFQAEHEIDFADRLEQEAKM